MIGKLSLEISACVTWEVPDLFKLPKTKDYYIESPQFHFTYDHHCLRLYPLAWPCNVDIELLRLLSHVSEKDASYKIGYKSITGIELETRKTILDGRHMFTARRFVFEKEKDTYVPEGTLTVVCRIRPKESITTRRLQSEVGEITFVEKALASHQDGNHGGLTSVDKLQSDYKHVLLKGTDSDACFVVSGKEFQVHRNVMSVRSPVLDAMLSHETAEKESCRVVINNLDPDSFPEFLQYVYTGRLQAFSDHNYFGVYMAADKYQLHTLKSECVKYMRKNLTMDSFRDVMALALRHNETDLLEQVVEF